MFLCLRAIVYRFATLFLSVSMLLAAVSCSGTKGTSPTAPSTPTAVTQTIHVVRNDGVSLGTTAFAATSGTNVVLTRDSLRDKGIDITSVDSNFMVIREANQGDRLGAFIENTSSGSLSFSPSDSTRVLWVMTTSNSADYSGAWTTGLGRNSVRSLRRYSTVVRLTAQNNLLAQWVVQNADISMILDALQILNNSWKVAGIELASMTFIEGQTGDIKAGIGISQNLPGAAGVHAGNQFMINPFYPASGNIIGRGIAVIEAVETLLSFDDILGADDPFSYFASSHRDDDLAPKGKDYVRFGALMARP